MNGDYPDDCHDLFPHQFALSIFIISDYQRSSAVSSDVRV
jgi:hypothetical protein